MGEPPPGGPQPPEPGGTDGEVPVHTEREWLTQRRQLTLQMTSVGRDIQRQLFHGKVLGHVQGEDLRSLHDAASRAREQWEQRLWAEVLKTKNDVTGVGNLFAFEGGTERFRYEAMRIDEAVQAFKQAAREEYDVLAAAEVELWGALQVMESKYENWKEQSASNVRSASSRSRIEEKGGGGGISTTRSLFAPPARKKNKETAETAREHEMERLRGAIVALDAEIAHEGGHKGGWSVEDHQIFLSLRTKHSNCVKTSKFVERLMSCLPLKSHEEAIGHIQWFLDYEKRMTTKKALLTDYNNLRKASTPRKQKQPDEEERLRQQLQKRLDEKNKELEEKKQSLAAWRAAKEEEAQKDVEERRQKEEEERKLERKNALQRRLERESTLLRIERKKAEDKRIAELSQSESRPPVVVTAEEKERIRQRNEILIERQLSNLEKARSASAPRGRPQSASRSRFESVESKLLNQTVCQARRVEELVAERARLRRARATATAHNSSVAGSWGHRVPGDGHRVMAVPLWRSGIG